MDPESAGGMPLLPGDAGLIFARGRLLISIEALTFWPRKVNKVNTAAEVTAMAQAKVSSLATAIVKTLPTTSEG
ncbi:hypothetical protein ACGFJ5_14405 [Micromonospora echinaurantiaca]|uniref:hypothetical protein n=1 Tax=Micromonospora echinaurantiaca TaxID=47857 RepID=UPI00370FDECC